MAEKKAAVNETKTREIHWFDRSFVRSFVRFFLPSLTHRYSLAHGQVTELEMTIASNCF